MDKKQSNKTYFTVAEIAKILGITRAAVHKQIKVGKIISERLGRAHAIPVSSLPEILRSTLGDDRKKEIDMVVKKVVKEYGQTLKLLGKE